jgi:hypothetical protein
VWGKQVEEQCWSCTFVVCADLFAIYSGVNTTCSISNNFQGNTVQSTLLNLQIPFITFLFKGKRRRLTWTLDLCNPSPRFYVGSSRVATCVVKHDSDYCVK